MYLDRLAEAIRTRLPAASLPEGDSTTLLRLYAALLEAKGSNVTQADVHNAWSVWMADRDPLHASLVPYSELDAAVQSEDAVFVNAMRSVADEFKLNDASKDSFLECLFPFGPPKKDAASTQLIELYKMMVSSSEALVSRRQAVNTFFLTINGALLTAYGLVAQNIGTYRVSGAALFVIAVAGGLLSSAWRSLITSFGQLNRGKFKVINAIERYLQVSIYAAEWEALGRGKDPNVYRSFTSREIWVPNTLLILHIAAAVIAVVVLIGSVSKSASSVQPSTKAVVETVAVPTTSAVGLLQAPVLKIPENSAATAPSAVGLPPDAGHQPTVSSRASSLPTTK